MITAYECVCVYVGTERKKEGKCKYLVHLCIAASVIKARMSYNYHPGSCAAHFSVVKKGEKQGDYMWDTGPQSIESSKPQNQVVSCCK